MRRTCLVAAIVLLGAVLAPATASADGTYHSAPIRLAPVDPAAGGAGQVENAHANGPTVYAHEQYQLRGAAPLTSYQVSLQVFVGDPTCAGAPDAVLQPESLTTNIAGNAAGNHVFTPVDAQGLAGTHGIIWSMTPASGSAYASGCETVVLD